MLARILTDEFIALCLRLISMLDPFTVKSILLASSVELDGATNVPYIVWLTSVPL
jgi:hypothetical protein